jgi:hypothetical protein
MNWIYNCILFFSTMFICYCLLLVGDWWLLRLANNELNNKIRESKQIEKLRESTEDIPQKEKAISEGFSPTLYPSVMDSIDLQYPLIAGFPQVDTYYCNEGYGLVRYRSDRFGFRNEDSYWEKHHLKLMIGDSYVHGACVTNDSTLPVQLSEQLNSTVLNLGMGGNNPSHYITYGNLFISKLKPTDVYLIFYPNDNLVASPSAMERAYVTEQKKLFSTSGLGLFDTDIFKNGGMKVISVIRDRIKSSDVAKLSFLDRLTNWFLCHARLPLITKIFYQNMSGFEMTERAIRSISDLCKVHGCNLVVSFIPNNKFYQPDYRADTYGDHISDLTRTLGLRFVDGRGFIDRSKGSEDNAPKGPHLSPIGYKKMAIAIKSN